MANIFGLNAWRDYADWNPLAPLVLCFGDSWVAYPMPDAGSLADKFNDFNPLQEMTFVAIGDVGVEIGDPGKLFLYQLAHFLEWEAGELDTIVVSGGGNDFAGPEDL